MYTNLDIYETPMEQPVTGEKSTESPSGPSICLTETEANVVVRMRAPSVDIAPPLSPNTPNGDEFTPPSSEGIYDIAMKRMSQMPTVVSKLR